MFDFHNHFTDKDSFKYSDVLLPQNLTMSSDIKDVEYSEVGLDKRFEHICNMSFQIDFLLKTLQYAKKKSIPVCLHCVNSTKKMLDILKAVNLEKGKIVWHCYTGSKETASELFKLGIIISIKANTKVDINQLYNANNMLVLETDYCGSSKDEHKSILYNHYLQSSKQLGMTIKELEEHCIELAKTFKS